MMDFMTFIEESEMELLDGASTISSRLAIREHNQILKYGKESFGSSIAKGLT